MKRFFVFILALVILAPHLLACQEELHLNTTPQTSEPSEDETPESPSSSQTPSTPTPPPTQSPTQPSDSRRPPETETPSPETSDPTDTTPVEDTSWLLHETADAGIAYQDSLTFLGDSTTAHMILRGGLTGGKETKQVWHGQQNTITFSYIETATILFPESGEYISIKEAARLAQPQYLVITLGVTGGVSSNLSEENFKKLYGWLLDTILSVSPNTTIIVQSIFPVNKVNSYEKTITNDKIVVYNGYIQDLVKEYHGNGKNIFYADTYSALIDEEGYLPAEYGNGDGLHISNAGYMVILRYLRTHAVTLQ